MKKQAFLIPLLAFFLVGCGTQTDDSTSETSPSTEQSSTSTTSTSQAPEEVVTLNGVTYRLNQQPTDPKYQVESISSEEGTYTDIVIEDQINGIDVISVSAGESGAIVDGDSYIKTITFNNLITTCNTGAFLNLTGLKKVTYGKKYQYNLLNAFVGCPAITEYAFVEGYEHADTYSIVDGAIFATADKTLVKWPAAKEMTEATAFPKSINIIGPCACLDYSSEKAIIPAGVVGVYGEAFRNTNAKKIEFPASLTILDMYAFKDNLYPHLVVTYGGTHSDLQSSVELYHDDDGIWNSDSTVEYIYCTDGYYSEAGQTYSVYSSTAIHIYNEEDLTTDLAEDLMGDNVINIGDAYDDLTWVIEQCVDTTRTALVYCQDNPNIAYNSETSTISYGYLFDVDGQWRSVASDISFILRYLS